MSTIEERLDQVCNLPGHYFSGYQSITADWNTAIDLLRQALEPIEGFLHEFDAFGDEDRNGMKLYRNIENHIAKMEGAE